MTDPAKSQRSGLVLPLIALAGAAAAGLLVVFWPGDRVASQPDPAPDPAATSIDCAEADKVIFERKAFCPGNRIVVFKFAGTVKPAQSGHPVELVTDAGRTATVLGPAPSPVNGKPQLARVRWDKQDWPDINGETVSLTEFESSIHADHIRLAN